MHRFEPTGSDLEGFWQITSSIDWCERNYVVSWYIAEFWNTLSSLIIILCGALDLYHAIKMKTELSFKLYAFSVIMVGIGTVCFHGSLTYIGQLGDELPMVWCMMVSWYILLTMEQKNSEGVLPKILAIYCVVFSLVHAIGAFTVLFQIHFVVLMFVPLVYGYKYVQQYQAHPQLRPLALYYATLWAVAGIVWLLDQLCCQSLHSLRIDSIGAEIPNPQLHAFWHILTGYCTHVGMIKLRVIRHMVLYDQQPKIIWICGFWPTINDTPPSIRPAGVDSPEPILNKTKSS